MVGFPAGLSPTSFRLLPTSFHLSPSSFLVVGFLASLSPTSFHLSPTSFHLSPSSFHLWVLVKLVSHFLSFVSRFFSLVCLPGWALVVGFSAGLSPTSFQLSPTSFHSPNSILLGVLNALKNGRLGAGWSGRVPGRLVSHFLHLSPSAFHLSPRLPFICLPLLFTCLRSFHLSPRLGACGRVPGWLVSHFLSFVSHFFSFVSQFFSFVSQAEWLWWGFRLACLPLPCICLPLLFICLPGWVPSGSRLACLPLPFICLPGSVLVVGFPAGLSPNLSPTSFHLSPRLGACGPVPGWLVSHFLAFVTHFLLFVSHFFSFVRVACLPLA